MLRPAALGRQVTLAVTGTVYETQIVISHSYETHQGSHRHL